MENGLMSFGFDGREVRVIVEGDTILWVANDVCEAVDVDRTSTRRLDDDEKDVRSIHTPGGTQEMAVVNEAGLYNLILGSRKPEAKAFKRWVTHEVIPSIRKNGMYAAPALLDDPDHLLRVTVKLVEERRARLAVEAKLIEQQPMVDFAETCLKSKDSILVRELAKLAHDEGLQIGEKRLYAKLREWGLILPGKTEPSQRAMDAGYFEVVQRPVDTPYGERLTRTTKVTPKGQVYIIERLRTELHNPRAS